MTRSDCLPARERWRSELMYICVGMRARVLRADPQAGPGLPPRACTRESARV